MKSDKSAGPQGIIAQIMKAAGEESIVLLRDLTEADHGNYCGLKLTDQAMKMLERVLDTSICGMVNIDSIQFGFCAWPRHFICNFHHTPSTGEAHQCTQATVSCLCRPRKGL